MNPQSSIRNLQSAIRTWCAALLALCVSPAALAADGLITITGEISTSTCKINGGDPPANLLVKLPKISTKALKADGDVAGATVFTIALTECPSSLSGDMKAHFEPGSTTDYGTGNLIAYTSTALPTVAANSIPSSGLTAKEHVLIQLRNLDGTAINIAATDQNASGFTLQTSGTHKQTNLQYIAEYKKKGSTAVDAGMLVTYVSFSLVYP